MKWLAYKLLPIGFVLIFISCGLFEADDEEAYDFTQDDWIMGVRESNETVDIVMFKPDGSEEVLWKRSYWSDPYRISQNVKWTPDKKHIFITFNNYYSDGPYKYSIYTIQGDLVEGGSKLGYNVVWGPSGENIYVNRGPQIAKYNIQHGFIDSAKVEGYAWSIYDTTGKYHFLDFYVGDFPTVLATKSTTYPNDEEYYVDLVLINADDGSVETVENLDIDGFNPIRLSIDGTLYAVDNRVRENVRTLQAIDINTGENREIYRFDYKWKVSGMAVSPSGSAVAFDMYRPHYVTDEPTEHEIGIFDIESGILSYISDTGNDIAPLQVKDWR